MNDHRIIGKTLWVINLSGAETEMFQETWWRHQMETFPGYWPFVWGLHRPPVNSPHKGQWREVLMFSFISAWRNCWVNNREAGDLRCHRAHYDVIVMNWSHATAADALVPRIVARLSAAMMLTLWFKRVRVDKDWSQLPVPSTCWEIVKNANIPLCFLK